MRDLDELERWMHAVITHPGGAREGVASDEARAHVAVDPDGVETVVTRSRALGALERLDVYNRAYFARLVDCLREEFPVLRHALGDDAFHQFAVDYLGKHASRSYTLNQLGKDFPRYLAESRPREADEGTAVGWPDFLIDLATLELAYSEVFDGPGVEGEPLLDAGRLRNIPSERWPDVRLVPVCCLRLLTLDFPVHRYIAAVRKHKEPAIPKASPTRLAVTRRRYVVRRYELSPLQYMLLEALVAGQSVGEAVARTAAAAGPDLEQLAEHLREWFTNWAAEGFFQRVEGPAD